MTRNPDTLEQLYRAHADAVFAFVLNLTRDMADTEDVLQEVFRRLVPESVYNVFARAFLPTPEPLIEDLLSTMTMARMATVACALERFRLAEGVYPSELKALSPRWLKQGPLDPLDHKVFRYERGNDGGFELRGSRPEWIWGEELLSAKER